MKKLMQDMAYADSSQKNMKIQSTGLKDWMFLTQVHTSNILARMRRDHLG